MESQTAPLVLRKLCLGSGQKKHSDAVNIDIVSSTGPDIVHDLNHTPWPLPSNQFDECHAYDVIEHLNDIVKTMEEIHRVCRNGAVVRITVPHFLARTPSPIPPIATTSRVSVSTTSLVSTNSRTIRTGTSNEESTKSYLPQRC